MRFLRRKLAVTAALCAACTAQSAVAPPPEAPVLHLPFDGSFEPLAGADLGRPKPFGAPAFVPGRHGEAVSLTGAAHLIVKLPDAVQQGDFTIAFWLKPLWHYADKVPHPILNIPVDPKLRDERGWAPGEFVFSKGWSYAIAPNHVYGTTYSLERHATAAMAMLLEDLGLQYDFIHAEQVARGELEKRGVKALVLAGQRGMTQAAARAVRRFAAQGGAVLADIPPARSDGLRDYDAPPLQDLFAAPGSLRGGPLPNSAADAAQWGSHRQAFDKGATLLFGGHPADYCRRRMTPEGALLRGVVSDFLAAHGVSPAVAVRPLDGAFQPATVVTYHDGNALYVGMQREYAVADPAPRDFEVAAPAEAHVYDVVNGKYLGRTGRPRLRLETARGNLLAFLPYRATAVRLEGLPESCTQGEQLRLRLVLTADGARPHRGVFRLEMTSPDGKRVRPLCRKLRWSAGVAETPVRIAFNDPVGPWAVSVADVATGTATRRRLDVRSRPAAHTGEPR